jgi:hypothetical protein
MVDETITITVRNYLNKLSQAGLPVAYGVVFGSQARGDQGKWSDIDLLVVSPRFDQEYHRADIDMLWHMAARTDNRIEPIPVGQQQYLNDDSSTIIEIARREGQIIPMAA